MQKTLVVLLAIYAAVVSTLLLAGVIGPKPEPARRSAERTGGNVDPAALVRDATTEAARAAERIYQANVKKQEARLEQLNTLVGNYEERLGDLDTWIEDLSRRNAGGMDQIVKDLASLRALVDQVKELDTKVTALGKRVKEVEDRPPVVREIIKTGPAKPDKPDKPTVPTLPGKTVEDPTVINEKIQKATVRLMSDKLAELWPAIEVMRKYKVKAAAPRLVEILTTSKHVFAKKAAATALGEIQWADAVPALADSLTTDKDVAQLAARAILKITGFDPELSHSARAKERRSAKNRVVAWWRQNEQDVRQRLGQPKTG